MAAFSAHVTPAPYYDPAFPIGEHDYPVETADVFFRGAVLCHSSGLIVADNADADTTVGVCTQGITTTAANDVVKVAVTGIWWFACNDFTSANLWVILAPLATSDNPADMLPVAAGTPSALGTLVHSDVSGTSGWLDLRQRVIPVNT